MGKWWSNLGFWKNLCSDNANFSHTSAGRHEWKLPLRNPVPLPTPFKIRQATKRCRCTWKCKNTAWKHLADKLNLAYTLVLVLHVLKSSWKFAIGDLMLDPDYCGDPLLCPQSPKITVDPWNLWGCRYCVPIFFGHVFFVFVSCIFLPELCHCCLGILYYVHFFVIIYLINYVYLKCFSIF